MHIQRLPMNMQWVDACGFSNSKLHCKLKNTMEHRYNPRAATNLNVLILQSEVPVAFGRIVNGSKIGFFIETDFSQVNLDQALDIEFISANSEENICRYSCNIRVIRKTALGLGVEVESTKVESNYIINSSRHPSHSYQNIPPDKNFASSK